MLMSAGPACPSSRFDRFSPWCSFRPSTFDSPNRSVPSVLRVAPKEDDAPRSCQHSRQANRENPISSHFVVISLRCYTQEAHLSLAHPQVSPLRCAPDSFDRPLLLTSCKCLLQPDQYVSVHVSLLQTYSQSSRQKRTKRCRHECE